MSDSIGKQLFVLVPVYNEEQNIPRLMHSLKSLSEEFQGRRAVKIILIDDGSRDGGSHLARKIASELMLDLKILVHQMNRGPGMAFATGFEYLSSSLGDQDLVLTIEGDNTSRIELIKQMTVRLEEGFEVIFASPYLYGGKIINTSRYRVFLSSMANLFIKELLGLHGILTVSSFFRLFRSSAVKKMQVAYGPGIFERSGFECMVEMTMKLVNLGITISEVPMILDTHARIGKSRMKIMRTIRGYFSLWALKKKWVK